MTIRARRVPPEALRNYVFHERVAPSLWFVPGLMVIGGFVLSRITILIDRSAAHNHESGWFFASGAGPASALTSIVASAMLPLVSVVFSTTLVAIQLASGQYSPRVVRIFVRSRLTHVTLGLFLATFVFSLNALFAVRSSGTENVPDLTVALVYVLAIVTLFMLIAFVAGMSRLLRVQYLLTQITVDGHESLEEAFPLGEEIIEIAEPDLSSGIVVRNRAPIGVVQAIDRASLVALAQPRGALVELLIEPGEYVGVGTPIARIHGAPASPPSGDAISSRFLLGAERTLVQDSGFALRQLVDVAVRSLSPAINDPTTAVQAIDRVTDLLGSVIDRGDPPTCYVDDALAPRLVTCEPGLARLLRLGFAEIIRFGAESPQVVRRLRSALEVLEGLAADQVDTSARDTVHSLRALLDDATAAAMPAAFAEIASHADSHGFG